MSDVTCYFIGSVFSLLSAEDREKLKRISDSAKHVAVGQSESRTTEKEINTHVAPETSTKSTSDSEYNCVMFKLSMKLTIFFSRY